MSIIVAIELAFMVFFLGLGYFFSSSEASIVAANPNLLKRMSAGGDRRAMIAYKLITNRKLFFGTILLGNNIAIVAFSTIGEYLISGNDHNFGLMLLRILIFDGIILVAGEIIPKSIALENPDREALKNAPAVSYIGKIFNPFIEALNYIPSLFIKGVDPAWTVGNLVSDKQFKIAFAHGHQAGIVDQGGKDLGLKVIDFAETTVERVMTLRGDIAALPAEITVREAYDRIRDHGFSRMPVYADDDEENIVGFLNVKDLIKAYVSDEHDKSLCELKRDINFIPYRKKILDMMLDFKKERSHIAMVVDEAGNITGLVTLEDLLEEVVGEIYDEHDEPEETIQKLGSDTYLVDGRLEVEDVNNKLGLELDEEEYESIGGFVMGLFGRVPSEGMSKQHAGAKFTVVKMDMRRIDQVKIKIEKNGNHEKDDA